MREKESGSFWIKSGAASISKLLCVIPCNFPFCVSSESDSIRQWSRWIYSWTSSHLPIFITIQILPVFSSSSSYFSDLITFSALSHYYVLPHSVYPLTWATDKPMLINLNGLSRVSTSRLCISVWFEVPQESVFPFLPKRRRRKRKENRKLEQPPASASRAKLRIYCAGGETRRNLWLWTTSSQPATKYRGGRRIP